MIAQLDNIYLKLRPLRVITRLVSYSLFEGRPVTTRGQWINPLVFAHFAIEKRLPQMKKVIKPIFITGSGRSGTTMLGVLLSMHRVLGFLNEPKAMWHSIYPNEDVIGSYGAHDNARYVLDENDATPEVIRYANRLFGAYLRSTFNERVVDKYPEHIFRLSFVRKIFPDSKFIFLVRNGWDTCVSIDLWSKRLGKHINGETHDWWGVNQRKWHLMLEQLVPKEPLLADYQSDISGFSDHINMAAVEWIITMQFGLRQCQLHNDAIILIRYEDLVANPGEELGKILEFCELTSDPVFFEYARSTLQSGRSHKPFKLHDSIRPAFELTMKELGYQ